MGKKQGSYRRHEILDELRLHLEVTIVNSLVPLSRFSNTIE